MSIRAFKTLGGADRFAVNIRKDGTPLRRVYLTRLEAELAESVFIATGALPSTKNRLGRANRGPQPRVTRYEGPMGVRWQSAVRFQENGKQRLKYLQTCATREEALAMAQAYIETGVEPPPKVKPPKPPKVSKKRGPKPGFKMALFVEPPKPATGADRWKQIYQQRIA